MCMLSFFPEGIQPVFDEIMNGADLNPDGHGYAIVTRDRRLLIHKGMSGPDMVHAFMKARKDNPDGPAIFHSRIATSGRIDVTGCHPFKVGQDNRTVLAHNGILFHPAGSERSDTRIFAEDMLPRMGSLDSPKRMRSVEKFLGKGNKVAVLTVNPQRRRTAYLINSTAGIWAESGAWHSNYDYEGRWWSDYDTAVSGFATGATKTGKPKTIRLGFSVFACEICGAWDAVSTADGVCEVCNSCNDCKAHILQCMCYVPHAQRKPAITVGSGEHSS